MGKKLSALLITIVSAIITIAPIIVHASTVGVENTSTIGVTYSSHVQNIGWQGSASDGGESGTDGKGLRLEAIKINLTGTLPAGAGITYKTQVQNVGWQDFVSNGAEAGTNGRGLREEAIKINLVNLPGYSVQYRVHVQNVGWQSWVSDGALAGTVGRSLRLEALEIKIVPPVNIHPTTLSLNKTTDTLTVGNTDTLISTVSPSNATNKAVVWITSDTNIATVDNAGKITAIAEGTANITATTVDGNKTASCTVTVNKVVNVTSVSLNKIIDNLTVGGTDTLTATVSPVNVTNKNVTWISSDNTIAIVNNAGKITALEAGTANITATTVDGGKTSTCTVTIINAVTDGTCNSSNNSNNMGFAATDGNWIYYISNYDGYLYRKEVGGSVTTLVTNDYVSYINVLNGHVYYCNDTDNEKLYSINVDGTDKVKLSDDNVSFVNAIGGYIYYYSNSDEIGLYRINSDGTGKIEISKAVENNPAQDVVIDNGWIYYTEQDVGNIYKMKIDGTGITKLSTNFGSGLVKNGEWLYYINSSDANKLYKLSVDGMSNVMVTDDPVICLGSSGDWIYYSYCADLQYPAIGGKLYKIKNDGTSKTLLTEDSPFLINIVNDWVYYSSLAYGGDMYKVKTDGTSHGPVDDTPPANVVVNTIGATNGNAVNDGLSAIQGDWIFYSDISGFYKMKSDGTEKIMLLDLRVVGINVVGNWVYFAPYPFQDVPYGICKMRTDGTDLIQLNEDDAHNIIVQGEWIYYINYAERNNIYKIKTDGSQRTLLMNDVYLDKFNLVADNIYYTFMGGNYPLYKIKTDGTNKQMVIDKAGADINILGEWAYYNVGGILYKTKLDGSITVALSKNGMAYGNVVGDWVYFADNSGIYKVKTDGTGQTILKSGVSQQDINICGDWLIYEDPASEYIQFIHLK